MTEYSRMAKGSFTATGTSAVVPLPFTPDFVEVLNYTNYAAASGTNAVTKAYWDASLIVSSNNPTMIELYNNSTVYATDVIATSGISTFQGALALQFGPKQQVVSATAANPAVFTVTGHGYNVGDTVMFEGLNQSSTTGMNQMSGMLFTISVVTTNTFTVKWNASGANYTALSGSPAGATVKKVLFPSLYAPGVAFISAITTAATTTIVTTNYHNMVVGQEVAFRVPTAWGTSQLNSLPNNVIPGSPIYGYVISVTDNWTVVVNINSTSFTAFNPNQPYPVAGLQFPQMLAVGDVNTGGVQISSGSQLYPPPFFPTSTSGVNTINGPAILGSFVNNTSQGFVIGAGTATTNTSARILANTNVIEWRAYRHDYSSP